MLFSGKTLVLFAKLKSLVEKDRKVVFISCLLPYEDVPPTYELIMRKKIEKLGNNIRFYSAMDICSEMDVTDRERSSYEMGVRIENYAMDICSEMGVTEKSFHEGVRIGYTDREKSLYSVLEKFVQNLPEDFNTLLIDEFGDYLSLDRFSVEFQTMEDKEEMVEVTGSLAGIEGKQLIISLHPRCKIDVRKLKDQGYEITELKYIMRNTASIWKYDKSVSDSKSDSRTSTVLGLHPVHIPGSGDKDFYSRIVEAVCKKSRKFVCLIPDDTRYDNEQFKAELGRRGIVSFVYLEVGDEKNLDKFLESREGCLITRFEHARGTESTTLLVFDKGDRDSRLLRGTTHLVVAQLYGDTNHFSVGEPEPDYILIEGNRLDPVVYSSLVDKMLENRVERYIIIHEHYNVELFLNELERRGLPPPVKKPRNMYYSVKNIKTHHQDISGGIMYDRRDIEDDCLKKIGAEILMPIIYIDSLNRGKKSVERIREGNPILFFHVKVG